MVLEFIDAPANDGIYTYAVASIRQENFQEAISGPKFNWGQSKIK